MIKLRYHAGWSIDKLVTTNNCRSSSLVRKRLDVAVRLTFHVHGRDVDWCIFLPSMLASYDSWLRHAGLMAIAAIGEGTSKVHRSWLFVFGEWGVGMLEYSI